MSFPSSASFEEFLVLWHNSLPFEVRIVKPAGLQLCCWENLNFLPAFYCSQRIRFTNCLNLDFLGCFLLQPKDKIRQACSSNKITTNAEAAMLSR